MPAQYKIDQVAELTEKVKGAEAIFVAEYRGLTVAQLSTLRHAVRAAGGECKVARNTLMKIALSNVGIVKDDAVMCGPAVYVIAHTNAPAVAKAIKTFAAAKENKAFVVKGGVMGSQIITVADIKALASMPSREQLLAMVVGTIAAPLQGLVTVLSAPARGLVTVLSQLAEKKGKEAPAA